MALQFSLVCTLLLFLNLSLILCQNHSRQNVSKQFGHHERWTDDDYSSYTDDSHLYTVAIMRVALAFGCLGSFLIGLCVVCCCRPECCKGKTKRGYILNSEDEKGRKLNLQPGPETRNSHNVLPHEQLPNFPPQYTFEAVHYDAFSEDSERLL